MSLIPAPGKPAEHKILVGEEHGADVHVPNILENVGIFEETKQIKSNQKKTNPVVFVLVFVHLFLSFVLDLNDFLFWELWCD